MDFMEKHSLDSVFRLVIVFFKYIKQFLTDFHLYFKTCLYT